MSSRRETGRAPARLAPPSRRVVLSGCPGLPFVGANFSKRAEAERHIAICSRWLVIDAEQRRLQLEWGSLEGRLMKAHGWHRLSLEQQAAIPEGARLAAIDARLDVLEVEGEVLLRAMKPAPATSVAAVAANLSVAARLIFSEDHPRAHGLITRAIRDLGAFSGGT